jgi:hypothetical protein
VIPTTSTNLPPSSIKLRTTGIAYTTTNNNNKRHYIVRVILFFLFSLFISSLAYMSFVLVFSQPGRLIDRFNMEY